MSVTETAPSRRRHAVPLMPDPKISAQEPTSRPNAGSQRLRRAGNVRCSALLVWASVRFCSCGD
jgi:hypothetical protein